MNAADVVSNLFEEIESSEKQLVELPIVQNLSQLTPIYTIYFFSKVNLINYHHEQSLSLHYN